MTRHIVLACFGVDADSPEQAKEAVTHFIEPEMATAQRIGLHDKYRINATVFVSPALDKLVGVTVKKDEKGE